jgi:class 3 adenylate cyclase
MTFDDLLEQVLSLLQRQSWVAYRALKVRFSLDEEVQRRNGMTLRLCVGLNCGEVVVRAIGNGLHMDYSAVGSTVHLAVRIEQLATPGNTLLTAATLQLVEGLVRVNALGPPLVQRLPGPITAPARGRPVPRMSRAPRAGRQHRPERTGARAGAALLPLGLETLCRAETASRAN